MQPDSERVVIESPSVRLARWLDAGLEREATIQVSRGEWVVRLWDWKVLAGVCVDASRADALSAALDQAEGVRDAG